MYNVPLELQQLLAFSEVSSLLNHLPPIGIQNNKYYSEHKKRKPSKKKLKIRNKNKMASKSRKRNRRK